MTHDLPEPLKHEPSPKSRYYFPELGSADLYDTFQSTGDAWDTRILERGLCYADEDSAIEHARVLLNLSGIDWE